MASGHYVLPTPLLKSFCAICDFQKDGQQANGGHGEAETM